MCVDDENAVSKKPPLLIAQDTRGTQVHRTLEVRERNKYIYSCLAVYPLMCAPEFITSCPHRATDVIFRDIKLSLC